MRKGCAYNLFAPLIVPFCVCLLSSIYLRFFSNLRLGLQSSYLQFGVLLTNKPLPIDPQLIAMIAPMICLLYTLQTSFTTYTCENINFFYRQFNLYKIARSATVQIMIQILLFTFMEAFIATVFDILSGAALLPMTDIISVVIIRGLVFLILVLFENVLFLYGIAFIGFLVASILSATITLNIPKLLLAVSSLWLVPFPTFHIYATLVEVRSLIPLLSCGYLVACLLILYLWLVFKLRNHDALGTL